MTQQQEKELREIAQDKFHPGSSRVRALLNEVDSLRARIRHLEAIHGETSSLLEE